MAIQIYDPFEDELRRRMNAARQQGWSDDEINRSALIERAISRRRQQEAAAQAPVEQKKGGRGGFATSLISEGGATGGAITGAGIGSMFGPIGTIVGGTIGGFLGGFGGSAAEQKVRDDNVDWGKAGVEGLFSAIPGGSGKIIRVAGREGVEQVSKGGLTSQVKQLFTPQPGVITDRVRNVAGDVRGAASGVRTGGRMEGRVQRLKPDEVASTRSFLQEVGAKGTAENQLRTVQNVERNAADNINAIVGRGAKPVSTEDIFNAQNRIRDRIIGRNGEGVGGFDINAHGPIADRYAAQMANVKDSQGWLNFKRSLDDDINYARNNQSVDPKVEQIAKMFRAEASDQLNRLHPDVAPFNRLYSQAQDAKNILVLNSDPKGIATGLLSVNGRGAGGKTVQRGADLTGRTLQRTANFASVPAVTQFGAQAGVSGIQNLFDGQQQPGQAQPGLPTDIQQAFDNPQNEDEMLLNEAIASGLTDFDSLSQVLSGGQPSNSVSGVAGGSGGLTYSSAQLTNAALAALQAGDIAAYKQYADAADLVASQEEAMAKSSGGGGPNITKVTAQQYGLAQSGYSAVNQLKQLLQSDPGVLSRTATPGRSLPIVGGFISNAAGTGDFDAIGYNIADSILRLRTGATANEGEVRKLQAQIIPRAGDSAQTIQTKLRQIDEIFGGVLSLAGNASLTSPMDDLSQLFAGQYAY